MFSTFDEKDKNPKFWIWPLTDDNLKGIENILGKGQNVAY